MSRIRSIHPGIATDEAFMAMTPYAKAVWPLLWMECDDNGIFEWKPLVLKARLLPADPIDLAELLEELVSLGCVAKFEEGGKPFGAVKNFAKFQRPKSPKVVHPIPPEMYAFVGLDLGGNRKEAGIGRPSSSVSSDKGETSRPSSSVSSDKGETSSEIEPQRKEEGGRKKEDSEAIASGADAPNATLDPKAILFERGLPLLSGLTGKPVPALRPLLGRWLKLTGNDAGSILAEIEKCRGSPVADPIAWIERHLKPREHTNGTTTQHEQDRRALAAVLEKRAHAGRGPLDIATGADSGHPAEVSSLAPPASPDRDARLRLVE